MKYIIEFFFVFVIIYFLWNILKRLIFNSLQKRVNNMMNNQSYRKPEEQRAEPQNKLNEPKLKWDAETVDYEEVKEDESKKP